jgi:large subunit ribosomal protein L15
MRLNQISDNPGATKTSKRVGRGIGSGKGKTAGRGVKGQTSRSGVAIHGYEGGQMPLHRRLPKRGFKNIHRKRYASVNIGRLQAAIDAGKLAAGVMDGAALVAAGVVTHLRDGFRLLAKGEITARRRRPSRRLKRRGARSTSSRVRRRRTAPNKSAQARNREV